VVANDIQSVYNSYVKPFRWDEAKNEELKQEKRPCFEDLVQAIAANGLVDDTPNLKHPGQRYLWVLFKEKIHLVPYEDRGDHFWLATAFPSSKATERWEAKKKEQDDVDPEK
jgi:hypothetical protein